MSKEHNIKTEWADVFECSCGFAYEGENRVEVERAHLYVNKFVDDCNEAKLREQIAREIEAYHWDMTKGDCCAYGSFTSERAIFANIARGK